MNYDGEDITPGELAYGIALLLLKCALAIAIPTFIVLSGLVMFGVVK